MMKFSKHLWSNVFDVFSILIDILFMQLNKHYYAHSLFRLILGTSLQLVFD